MSALYLRGGLVLPLDGSERRLDPGVVVVEGSRIVHVGEERSAPPPAPEAEVIECEGLIVMPGLVNSHTHTGMSFFRNLLEDLPSADWFRFELDAERRLSREDIYWATLLGSYELLRHGVTTIADRFSHMDVIAGALEHAGIRAVIAPSLVDRDAEARKRQTEELLERYGTGGDGLIRVGIGPVGPDSCSTDLLRWCRATADRSGALIFIHLAQSLQELAEIARRGYEGSVRYLDAIGLLGPDVVAAHCIYVDDEEIALLARRGVRVAHCPASNAKIEGRVAPVRELLAAGARVGLGTDCVASSNRMDLFDEMRLAGLLQKVAAASPLAMPVDTLLALGTRAAADCLDLGGQVGSLEVGMQADLITVRRRAPHLEPWTHPEAGLVYAAVGHDVRDVWVAGRGRVRDGRLLADDVDEATERAAAWTAAHAAELYQERLQEATR